MTTIVASILRIMASLDLRTAEGRELWLIAAELVAIEAPRP